MKQGICGILYFKLNGIDAINEITKPTRYTLLTFGLQAYQWYEDF